MTLLHSCSNGACTPNLFGSLLNGAALYPFDVKKDGVAQLVRFVSIEGITIYHSIPVLFRGFVHSLTGTENLSNIRVLHLSGDAATKNDAVLYKKHLPAGCIFVHRLGSREANTVFLYLIDKSSELLGNTLPVGPPVAGKEVLLVDDDGTLVRDGEVGEIVIKSRYLSPGYWRDPESTSAVFETSSDTHGIRRFRTGDIGRLRSDGYFEHLGRKDARAKIRGYRVELGEVEIAILNQGNLKQVAVVARENNHGDKELVAYVVPSVEPVPSASELRRFLEPTLPFHMIPSAFVFVKSLPFLPNGKIDRRSLPDPGNTRPELDELFVAPRTPVEEAVANIWADVLSVDQVGIHDSFFDLGGHSLSASKILARVQRLFDVELPLNMLFEKPTIADLAQAVSAATLKTA